MSLVNYSSSSGEDTNLPKKRKRKHPAPSAPSAPPAKLPPLPAGFHDLYSGPARVSTTDDPALHGGRKRGVPHVEGNWAAHVYLEWHLTPAEHALLTDLLTTSHHQTSTSIPTLTPPQTLLTSPLSAPLPLHISLSAPLVLTTPLKAPFLTTLTSALRGSFIRPFAVRPTRLDWAPNADRSRWFLVLRVGRPTGDELGRLLRMCNEVVRGFGLGALYCEGDRSDDGKGNGEENGEVGGQCQITICNPEKTNNPDTTSPFHISLAWQLSPPTAEQRAALRSAAVEEAMRGVEALEVNFDCVKVRVGRDVTVIRLGGGRRKTDAVGEEAD